MAQKTLEVPSIKEDAKHSILIVLDHYSTVSLTSKQIAGKLDTKPKHLLKALDGLVKDGFVTEFTNFVPTKYAISEKGITEVTHRVHDLKMAHRIKVN